VLAIGLQSLLPQIEQFLPARSLAVKQKLNDLGMADNSRAAFGQIDNLIQQGTADSLMAAAASAPPGMRPRLYQQAALKALEEGNTDRARQIANDNLDPSMRNFVNQSIDLKLAARSAAANRVEEVRRVISRVQNEDERVRLILQVVGATQTDNPKVALQLLEEARNMVLRRVSSYRYFDAQISVAHAFAALDPARSFELLEPGISHINELVSAAALLNGFEVNIFRDGELPIQNGSGLTNMALRYGQELAALARIDFERAQMLADRFQSPEPRIIARMAIARGLLGKESNRAEVEEFTDRRFGRETPFIRRPQ
jgi:hypothetical protein